MNLRKIFFWAHLVSGLAAGLVIALLALTGLALSFEPQIVDFMERDVRRIPVAKADATKTSIEDLMKYIREEHPDARPTGFTIYSDPQAAIVFPAGRGLTFYVDPNTESIKEAGNAKLREFFNFTLSLHRYLALSGPQRQIGDKIVGVATCVFLALSVTGLIIWWPRRWNWRSMRPSVIFISARGKLRDWNWHNVIGLWTTPLLIIICVTGLMMSYRWVGNLAFVLTGTPVPAARGQGAPGGGEGGGAEGAGRQGAPAAGNTAATSATPGTAERGGAATAAASTPAQPEGGMGGGPGGGGDGLPAVVVPTPPRGTRALAYDPLLAKVRETYPNWTQITVRAGGNQRQQRRPGGGGGAGGPAGGATPTAAPATSATPTAAATTPPATTLATPPADASATATPSPAATEPTREGRPAGGGERGERGAGGSGARTPQVPQAVSVTLRTSDMWFSTSSLTLSLDPYTGDILRTQGFADQNLGRRLRALARPVHMGLIAGWPTQLLAAIATLGTLFLVYTGFALSWRRFFGKNARNKKAKNKPAAKPVA